jgi:drug/metabolite transporter (DMT)-like permease
MKASSLSFKGAVLCVIAGMAWGLHMAISDNHSAYPAHAHLNLIGWVSLFLIGIYYRLHPALERARSAHLQVWSWLIGTVVMAIGVGLVHTGTAAGEPLAAAGSLIVFASALLFAWLLFRTERAGASALPAAAPAE